MCERFLYLPQLAEENQPRYNMYPADQREAYEIQPILEPINSLQDEEGVVL